MKTSEKKSLGVTNEFDQEIKGVSLAKDAWRRLKKNRMAMVTSGKIFQVDGMVMK